MIDRKHELKKGDVLSESSHYIVKKVYSDRVDVEHFESGDTTMIATNYLHNYANSADYYDRVEEVTKEDKRDGTPGIRTIFEGIHSGQVFTVCFKKQDKAKTKKAYEEEIASIVEQFSAEIDAVKTSKKGVAKAAKTLVQNLISKPVLPYVEGERRILRGYKVQFTSRDGKYNCVDMDIERTDTESGVRPVNINTINWLIFNGVKYVVK